MDKVKQMIDSARNHIDAHPITIVAIAAVCGYGSKWLLVFFGL